MLVKQRGEKPDSRHYYALILANSDAALGSVEEVKRLLQEMENERIPIDSTVHHAVLRVGLSAFFVIEAFV